MRTNLLLLFAIALLSGFKPATKTVSDLESQLQSLTRSFAANANPDDCENYFKRIKDLQEDIEEAMDDAEEDVAALRKLQKKTKALYEFAATLTRCPNTSNELEVGSFNVFIAETGLSPTLVKRNGCASIYKVKINGFQTYYAVNGSSESKALKIAMPGSTFTMNIMCNSVEGFSQGVALNQISSATITCSSASLPCYN